jgi:type VI secretion system protein ImpK
MESLSLRRYKDYDGSYVLHFFELFYEKVLLYKKRILSGEYVPISSSTDLVPGDLNSDSAEGARFIRNKLKDFLETEVIRVDEENGEFASNYFREVVYIMAALADEIFLNISWKGRKYWEDNLLESALFNTHDAGDQFFEKLSFLLSSRDAGKKDLAQIYLISLGLGFLGKYRDTDDHGALRRYSRQLFAFVNHKELRMFDTPERVFAEAYMHTIDDGPSDLHFRMNPIHNLGLKIGLGALCFVLISHIFWSVAISDVRSITAEIRKESLL